MKNILNKAKKSLTKGIETLVELVKSTKNQKPKGGKIGIYQYFTEEEQLKRLAKACGKLAYACGEFKGTRDRESLEYLMKRIAEAEFLTEQVKAMHNLEVKVFNKKYYLEEDLKKQIDNIQQLEEVLEGV